MRKALKRTIRLKRMWMLLLLPIAIISLEISKHSTFVAEEIFASRIFKVYSQIISSITGLVPFSIAEWAIVFGTILIPAAIIFWVLRIIKNNDRRWDIFFKGILDMLCIACLAVMILVLGCSINYYREPFSSFANLEVRDSSKEELQGLCYELAADAVNYRSQINSENEDGIYELSMSVRELSGLCRSAYDTLSVEYPILGGLYPRTKSVFFSRQMSMAEFTGMYVPFTMEANINTDASDYSIASTMCHELAHLRGFIREDEANYIAYIACMASDNAEVKYSGSMEALIYAGNALYAKDAELYWEVRATYSEEVVADLAANSAYWAQFHDTKISNTADTINDTYLKANDQEDGVASYGRMVDLLLAAYRKKHASD